MRYFLILMMVAVPCYGQTTSGGAAQANGPCSLANTGNNNKLSIICPGMSAEDGAKMLQILNTIAANQLDKKEVISKLDEIIKNTPPAARSIPQNKEEVFKAALRTAQVLLRLWWWVRVRT
jgi:hypothetical protein